MLCSGRLLYACAPVVVCCVLCASGRLLYVVFFWWAAVCCVPVGFPALAGSSCGCAAAVESFLAARRKRCRVGVLLQWRVSSLLAGSGAVRGGGLESGDRGEGPQNPRSHVPLGRGRGREPGPLRLHQAPHDAHVSAAAAPRLSVQPGISSPCSTFLYHPPICWASASRHRCRCCPMCVSHKALLVLSLHLLPRPCQLIFSDSILR